MSLNHLSDEALQSCLAEGPLRNMPEAENHLKECASCRTQLDAYRLVEDEFCADSEEIFSDDFEELIIQRIHTLEYRRLRFKSLLLMSLSLIMGIGVILSGFLNPSPEISMHQAAPPGWSWLGEILQNVMGVVQRFGLSFGVLFFGMLTVLFFGFLDQIIDHPNDTRHT